MKGKDEKSLEDEKFLEIARKRYQIATDADNENINRGVEAKKFREGSTQWPEKIKRERERDFRPCLVLNRVKPNVRRVVNDLRQQRPGIKIRPVDGQADPKTASIINGMIRAIEKDSMADVAYDWAGEDAITSGFGYFRVTADYENDYSFNQVLRIVRVRNPFTIHLDPDASEPDGCDLKYAFVDSWTDIDEFKDKYNGLPITWQEGSAGTGRELWYKTDKVFTPEYWVQEEEESYISLMPGNVILPGKIDGAINTREVTIKKVKQYKITGQDILEEKEFPGTIIPIIPVYGEEIDIEGELILKGMVEDLMDAQRNYNYWRTSSTERVALSSKAPWIGPKGSFKNPKWRNANRKNYAYLEYDFKEGSNQPPPWRDPPADIPAGMVQESNLAAEDLKAISNIQDPALGIPQYRQSEDAILAYQKEADTSNFHFKDNLARAQTRLGKILVHAIPKIYDTARMVSIIDPAGKEDSVLINQQHVDQKTMKPVNYDLRVGRYDAIADTGPTFATQRQEASKALMSLAEKDQRILPLIGDLLGKNLDISDSDEISRRLAVLLPEEVKGEDPRIKQIISQFNGEKQALIQALQQLQEENKSLNHLLMNKQGEISVKMKEQERKADELALKESETRDKSQREWAKLELDNQNEMVDIPGKGVNKVNSL